MRSEKSCRGAMLLFPRRINLNVVRYLNKPARQLPPLHRLVDKINTDNVSVKYENALKKFENKIWFNSVLEVQSIRLKQYDKIIAKKEQIDRAFFQNHVKPLPLVLNQLCDGAVSALEKMPEKDSDSEKTNVIHDLPYSRFLKVGKTENTATKEDRLPKNWLQDYELYDESESEIQSTYGTPNPKVPVSEVPCNGCGAHLHCKEPSIPGYVPSELFTKLTAIELKTIHCQRCHFLINYNTAINVSVKPEDYINIISTIKDKHALIIVLVDLLDFPCSVFNGLKDLLGSNRPVFIVGNKV